MNSSLKALGSKFPESKSLKGNKLISKSLLTVDFKFISHDIEQKRNIIDSFLQKYRI